MRVFNRLLAIKQEELSAEATEYLHPHQHFACRSHVSYYNATLTRDKSFIQDSESHGLAERRYVLFFAGTLFAVMMSSRGIRTELYIHSRETWFFPASLPPRHAFDITLQKNTKRSSNAEKISTNEVIELIQAVQCWAWLYLDRTLRRRGLHCIPSYDT
jgi:hypothetical protein